MPNTHGLILTAVFGLIVTWFLVWSWPATAVEPICPGGSSPRADIVLCIGFDTLTNCTTGIENQCWNDNGFNTSERPVGESTDYSWKIVRGNGAVGAGFATSRAPAGSVGSGVAAKEYAPGCPPLGGVPT
jgi:hypothetical protein